MLLRDSNAKRSYLAFRGTDGEGADLETDLDFALVPYGDSSNNTVAFLDGDVHSGFNTNLFGEDKLYVALDEIVRSTVEQYPDHELVICGHSLGGALAILYSAHVAKTLLPDSNVKVQTIGTPRVGDGSFKNSMRDLSNLANWRLVYEDDVIPRIPLRSQGYRHTGHLILMRDNEVDAYFDQWGDDENYAAVGADDWLLDMRLDSSVLIPIFHHMPWSYLRGIDYSKKYGLWPDEFVDITEQEKVCCWMILFLCVYQCYP